MCAWGGERSLGYRGRRGVFVCLVEELGVVRCGIFICGKCSFGRFWFFVEGGRKESA
jgi:hypothetical protein